MAARKNPSAGGKPDKLWRDALNRAIKRREEDDPKALERLADNLLNFAFSADASEALPALKELGDRLDGKPKQQLEHTGEDGADIPLGIAVRFVGTRS